MAKQLSFAQFDAKLKSGTLTAAEYRKYLEVDPTADVIRVRLKPGALRDEPPPGYDVDREVYSAERAKQERELEARPLVALKRVVAEGDSWFCLPPLSPFVPPAIADQLSSRGLVDVKNIARWGHTLVKMLEDKEYLDVIPKFKADWFIFSGGGNDLQESLMRGELVLPYDASRPIDQCLSPCGLALLQEIAEGYRTLLNEIAVAHPTLPSICYAYDFPRPTFRNGQYIGQYLKKMGYPKSTWDQMAKFMIDRLSEVIKPVVKSFPNSQFLDCRCVTAPYPFFDDMHPKKEGFKALTQLFEHALGVAIAPAEKSPARGRAASKRKAAKAKSPSRPARSPTSRRTSGEVAKTN